MYDRITGALRPHFATIAHLATRDMPLQIVAGLITCGLIAQRGHLTAGIAIALWIIVAEGALLRIFTRRAPFRTFTKEQMLLLALGLCSFTAFMFALPALYLAAGASLAIKVVALLWVIGVQVYVTNTWSRMPIFLYAMLVPAMIMLVVTIFTMRASITTSSPPLDWVIAFGFMMAFLYVSIDTLRQHVATERALGDAEHKASARLSQLEESQRLDSLTGLLNRPAFDTALDVMLADRAIIGGEIAVFLIDLDSFKPINDTYSHAAGDTVLAATADRIKRQIGSAGIVGRMGGDEFICAVQDLPDTATALAFGRDISTVLTRPIMWNDRKLKISASVGVSMTGSGPPAPKGTVQALCSAADQAMFAAKTSPNAGPVLYEAHLFAPRMTPDDKQILVDAISNQKLRPHYQPKIHLPTGQIIGFEALARWHHPDGTLRRPDTFVEQINELGLQGDFMTCIAAQVVEDVQALLDAGLDPGQVSFNVPEVALATLSGRQDLQRIVSANANAAKHLTFEITEDVFIARAAEAIQASIATFRQLGVRISLDDFGTGFASFHHLRQLDFDEMKIDTSFVAGLGHDPTADVLVRGFLNIASGLGVSVIAEGVETEDQSRDLINMGCLMAQGYLFSQAVPLDQATQLLLRQQAA